MGCRCIGHAATGNRELVWRAHTFGCGYDDITNGAREQVAARAGRGCGRDEDAPPYARRIVHVARIGRASGRKGVDDDSQVGLQTGEGDRRSAQPYFLLYGHQSGETAGKVATFNVTQQVSSSTQLARLSMPLPATRVPAS